MNPLTKLLAGRDRWSGAACHGKWRLFDPRREDEPGEDYQVRVFLAQGFCARCPIFDKCRDYAANARPRDRAGTWAGQPFDANGRPVRIDKEGTAK